MKCNGSLAWTSGLDENDRHAKPYHTMRSSFQAPSVVRFFSFHFVSFLLSVGSPSARLGGKCLMIYFF